MRIKVKADGHNIRLALPNFLILGGISRFIVSHCLSRYTKTPLTRAQLKAITAELRRCHTLLHGRPLVDVRTHDGEVVIIRL